MRRSLISARGWALWGPCSHCQSPHSTVGLRRPAVLPWHLKGRYPGLLTQSPKRQAHLTSKQPPPSSTAATKTPRGCPGLVRTPRTAGGRARTPSPPQHAAARGLMGNVVLRAPAYRKAAPPGFVYLPIPRWGMGGGCGAGPGPVAPPCRALQP